MTTKYFAFAVALPLLLTACGAEEPAPEPPAAGTGGADSEESPTAADSPSPTDTGTGSGIAGGDVGVEVADVGALGQVLVDGDGMTLYMFDPDAQGESTCYDACENLWPPLLAEENATAGEGADDSMIGSVEREDGTQQVTYNDWPLYYYTPDEASGDAKGQGVNEVWWVLNAQGEPVRQAGQ